jgi:multidrug efflux pump subunit AcrA (membrane-fusion protein)
LTLADGRTTPGVVSSVGAVATTATAGSLDQAPVTVNITTSTARDVLAVPVTALLARSPGGYVVEVAARGNARRYVPVTPGIFDDNSGLLQVTGALTPGQRVVVASS